MSYTKLFSSIVTSTIWSEDDETRLVWITMLAIADKNGEVQASIPGLARVAGVSVEATEKAVQKFLSPDIHSRTKDDGGRRVEIIDGGWMLINHAKYRAMASKDEQKIKTAERVRRFRERKKRNGGVTHKATNVTHTHPESNALLTHDRDIADTDLRGDTPLVPPQVVTPSTTGDRPLVGAPLAKLERFVEPEPNPNGKHTDQKPWKPVPPECLR